MDQDNSKTLNQAQIRHLLTVMGGPAGSTLSPLTRERFPEEGDPSERLMLEEGLIDPKGGLCEPWNQVFQSLSRPSLEIIAAVGFPEGRKSLCGYGSFGDMEKLVGFTPLNETEYRIVYPLSKDPFLSLLVVDLGLDLETPVLGVETEMDLETLLTLAGMIDAGREAQMEAMLARESEPDREVRFDRILYNTRKGLTSNDYRWLASAIRNLIPFEVTITQKTILSGLKELQKIGWVEKTGEKMWLFTETFDIPRKHFESLINFGILSIQRHNQEGIERIHLGILRTLGSLWILDFKDQDGDKPTVWVGTAYGPGLAQALDRVVEATLQGVPQPEELVGQSFPQEGGLSTVLPKKSFCGKCGAPAQPEDRFCINCGNKL